MLGMIGQDSLGQSWLGAEGRVGLGHDVVWLGSRGVFLHGGTRIGTNRRGTYSCGLAVESCLGGN